MNQAGVRKILALIESWIEGWQGEHDEMHLEEIKGRVWEPTKASLVR